jgi:hypothetical protein
VFQLALGTSAATVPVTSSESISNAATLKADPSLIDQPSPYLSIASTNTRDASSNMTIATINNISGKEPSSRDIIVDHKKTLKGNNDQSSYELLQLFDKNGENIDISA